MYSAARKFSYGPTIVERDICTTFKFTVSYLSFIAEKIAKESCLRAVLTNARQPSKEELSRTSPKFVDGDACVPKKHLVRS